MTKKLTTKITFTIESDEPIREDHTHAPLMDTANISIEAKGVRIVSVVQEQD